MKFIIGIGILLLVTLIGLTACINIYNPPATSVPPATTTSSPPATTTSSPPPTTVIPTPITPTVTPIPLVQFENRTWVLEKYGKAAALQNAIAGKEVTVRFDSAGGKVSGSAGCNSYNGSYTRLINKVTVTGLMSTMMSCPIPPGIMQQEMEFKDALGDAESCRIVGTKLEINCTLNRLLIFHPK